MSVRRASVAPAPSLEFGAGYSTPDPTPPPPPPSPYHIPAKEEPTPLASQEQRDSVQSTTSEDSNDIVAPLPPVRTTSARRTPSPTKSYDNGNPLNQASGRRQSIGSGSQLSRRRQSINAGSSLSGRRPSVSAGSPPAGRPSIGTGSQVPGRRSSISPVPLPSTTRRESIGSFSFGGPSASSPAEKSDSYRDSRSGSPPNPGIRRVQTDRDPSPPRMVAQPVRMNTYGPVLSNYSRKYSEAVDPLSGGPNPHFRRDSISFRPPPMGITADPPKILSTVPQIAEPIPERRSSLLNTTELASRKYSVEEIDPFSGGMNPHLQNAPNLPSRPAESVQPVTQDGPTLKVAQSTTPLKGILKNSDSRNITKEPTGVATSTYPTLSVESAQASAPTADDTSEEVGPFDLPRSRTDNLGLMEIPAPPSGSLSRAGTAPPQEKRNKIKARWSMFAKKAVETESLRYPPVQLRPPQAAISVPVSPYTLSPQLPMVSYGTPNPEPTLYGPTSRTASATVDDRDRLDGPPIFTFTRTDTSLTDGLGMMEVPPPPGQLSRAETAPPQEKKARAKARWSAFAKKAVATDSLKQPSGPVSQLSLQTGTYYPQAQSQAMQHVTPHLQQAPQPSVEASLTSAHSTPPFSPQLAPQSPSFQSQASLQGPPFPGTVQQQPATEPVSQFAPNGGFISPVSPINPQLAAALGSQYSQQYAMGYPSQLAAGGYMNVPGVGMVPVNPQLAAFPPQLVPPGMPQFASPFGAAMPASAMPRGSIAVSSKSKKKARSFFSLVAKASAAASEALDDPTTKRPRKESTATRKSSIVDQFLANSGLDPEAARKPSAASNRSLGVGLNDSP
ncbi:hypothetical protein BJ508DRAFT_5042 [Ascobolus immersus RN42]|uniref:Uncharacterized protein n=1 Tax=Ascobolus immersus RN42 TaxID=1160509 RepID=A0A3N4IU52_ASCIM|nr:hypothetical protein BJ508DRAFT_5042 [Ascobolus immersus RN42]